MILILKHRNIDHTFICYTARQNKEASFTMLTISRVISATVILSVYWQQYVVLFLVVALHKVLTLSWKTRLNKDDISTSGMELLWLLIIL